MVKDFEVDGGSLWEGQGSFFIILFKIGRMERDFIEMLQDMFDFM